MSKSIVNHAVIRERREAMGLTMEEAAQRAGFTGRQAWYSIESGHSSRPSIDSVAAVAHALMCHVDDLLLPFKPKR
jgi:transcriptional regulator with XRE-family HTH domain